MRHVVRYGVPDGTTSEGPPASPEAGTSATPAEPPLSFDDVQELGGTPLVAAGQLNHYEVNLGPGIYVLICFLPDPTGMPHLLVGLIETCTVDWAPKRNSTGVLDGERASRSPRAFPIEIGFGPGRRG